MLSVENKLVKDTLKLKMKKYRDAENKYVIEGVRFIEEAVNEENIQYLIYSSKLYETNGYDRVFDNVIEKYEVEDEVLKRICDTENPQGICAVVEKKKWNIKDIKNTFVAVADGIQDPGNLGTIIRTCDAAGAGGIVIIKGSADVYSGKTLRATMGSIFHLPVIFYDDFKSFAEDFKKEGYAIYASDIGASKYIYDCSFDKKTAVVIGNEANGIPDEHMAYSDVSIKIPMPGRAESLNASTAASIIIYEVVRQRIISKL
jgi:TrmH family RNA methyltransferase